MFDWDPGIQISAYPNYYSTTDTITLSATVLPLYGGVGHWLLSGSLQSDGNAPVGTAYSPVAGEFGRLRTPVSFVGGERTSIKWRVLLKPTEPQHSARLTVAVGFDSVLVDGKMYAVDSLDVPIYTGFSSVGGFVTLYEP
jgi:hypothetical protein